MIEFSTTITQVKDQPSATPPYPGIVPIYGYPPYILPDDKLGPLHSEREACSFPWCGCVHDGRA